MPDARGQETLEEALERAAEAFAAIRVRLTGVPTAKPKPKLKVVKGGRDDA